MNIEKDMGKAIKLFHRAAELGSGQANWTLGVMYDKSDGVSKEEAKARQYYEKGAMAGDVTSRLNVGVDAANTGNFDRAIKHWLIEGSYGNGSICASS
jgi:TPR repeat protein